ncbi:MAG: Gfo/Idh/MocA family protein [Devosia sp.]
MAVRVAVVGCGYFARYHLAAWQKLSAEGAELVAVCDIDPEKAQRAAVATGARAFTDVGAMLAEARPELVDIATRMDTHAALVTQCALAGAAMIVQKPLAPTGEEASRIVGTARDAGVFLAVHENFRYQAAMMRVGELLRSGAIGAPNWARIAFRTGIDVYANQPYFYGEERLVILDLGIHLLDLARVFMGEVETVYCQTQRRNPRVRAEDTATIMLRHSAGATSIVECTYEARRLPLAKAEAFVEIEGTEGSIVLDRQLQLMLTSRDHLSREDLVPADFDHSDPAAYVARQSVYEASRQILRAYRSGEPAATSGEDNLKTFALVEAAYRSAATGRAERP